VAPQIVTEEREEVIDSGRWLVMFSVSVVALLASFVACVVVWKSDVCELLHKMCSLIGCVRYRVD
jgi:hypothetical protein